MYNLVDESTFTLQRGLEFLANAYMSVSYAYRSVHSQNFKLDLRGVR